MLVVVMVTGPMDVTVEPQLVVLCAMLVVVMVTGPMDVTVEPQLVQWLKRIGAGQDTVDKVDVVYRLLFPCPCLQTYYFDTSHIIIGQPVFSLKHYLE